VKGVLALVLRSVFLAPITVATRGHEVGRGYGEDLARTG